MNLRAALAVFFTSYLAYCNAEEQLLHRELTDLVSGTESSSSSGKNSPAPTPVPEMCEPEAEGQLCMDPDFACVCECSKPEPEFLCADRCDGFVPRPGQTPCFCDELCTCYRDCCDDYVAQNCGHNPPLGSCTNSDFCGSYGCGIVLDPDTGLPVFDSSGVPIPLCYCDGNCTACGDCCDDFNATACNITPAEVCPFAALGTSGRPQEKQPKRQFPN